MTPKTSSRRELRANVFGWLIQSWTMAAPRKSKETRKFFVGSGRLPLKMSNATPAAKAPMITAFAPVACSSRCIISFAPRRRRVLPEARPRLISSLRLRKSNILLPTGRRRAVLLIRGDDRADKLVPHHVTFGEVGHRDARDIF